MDRKQFIILFLFLALFSLLPLAKVRAMPVGTLLYRTSGDDKMYGYNTKDLLIAEKGILKHIYSGHVAIYVGKEDGVDYIVEMQSNGAIKVPAKYFINEDLGEKLVGAKIPAEASPMQIAKAVSIAKNLADLNVAYDFSFKQQKGPNDKEWTCVGLTEKVYESANISNPSNLQALEYDPDYYAVNITPDDYDNFSIFNSDNDCFAKESEFSKINAKKNMLLPAPELLGFDVGLEYRGERYFFIPYTQYLQDTLVDVDVDIPISSSFSAESIRGDAPIIALVLKWSLINNPISSIKNVGTKVAGVFSSLKDKIFSSDEEIISNYADLSTSSSDLVSQVKKVSSSSVTTKTKSQIVTSTTLVKNSVISSATTSSSNIASPVVEVVKSFVNSKASTSVAEPQAVSKVTITPITNVKKSSSTTPSISKFTLAKPVEIKPVNIELEVEDNTTQENSTLANEEAPVVVAQDNQDIEFSTSNVPSTTTIIINTNISPIVNTTSTTEPDLAPVEEDVVVEEEPLALIAKIYSNAQDDWLQIVNASDFDFDLAEISYRLEKAKTALDPTIILRFGNEDDASFPGGTIIKAHGYYLVASIDSPEDIKSQADAIVTKDTFSWTEDAYTIYLARGPVSSDEDEDIIDKVGYGEAKYFKTMPAPALQKGYALERKASATSTLELMTTGGLHEFWPRLYDSGDNSEDFILTIYDASLIEEETDNSEDNNTDNNDNNESNNNSTSTSADVVINEDLFVNPLGLDVVGLTNLWHFDECYGETAHNSLEEVGFAPVNFNREDSIGAAGKWGCGLSFSSANQGITTAFNYPIDLNQSTINFYYKFEQSYGDFKLRFFNDDETEREASIFFNFNYTEINGFPGPDGRIPELYWSIDNEWHQVSIVIDRENKYWAMYLDANEVYRYEYQGVVPTFKFLEIKGEKFEKVFFDELSILSKSLSLEELQEIHRSEQPFNPYNWPEAQKISQLEYYWNFDENMGTSTKDSVKGDYFQVASDKWNMEGKINSAITIDNSWQFNFNNNTVDDLALTFWWRNFNSPNEARFDLALGNNSSTVMAIKPTMYNPMIGFNNQGTYIPNETMPSDDAWHYLALTYDSYQSLLSLYVDGERKYTSFEKKLRSNEFFNQLRIVNENWPSAIDELKVYSGLLTAKQIADEYELLK